MTEAVRKVYEMTEDELRALIRSELERPKVDAPKLPAVRRKPSAEVYERIRKLRRRKGYPE